MHGKTNLTSLRNTSSIYQHPARRVYGATSGKARQITVRLSTKEFVGRAKTIHGNAYSYEKTVYKNSSIKVCISCHVHGDFWQTPENHLYLSKGCKKCGTEKNRIKQALTTDEFIEKSRAKHGDIYIYSKSVYLSQKTKITITCRYHGDFRQLPSNHMKGHGCPACGRKSANDKHRRQTKDLFRLCRGRHGNKYEYDFSCYRNSREDIRIKCPVHGWFQQSVWNHAKHGQGCPKCGRTISTADVEIAECIEGLGVRVERNTRKILKGSGPNGGSQELDIYCPDYAVAVEHCGLYYHSDAVRADKEHLLNKHEACKALGIRLITVFEDEWLEKRPIIEAFFGHLFGLSKKGHYARNLTIRAIDTGEANKFLNNYHLQGASRSRYRCGAFSPDNELIGVMTFGAPSDERGKIDFLEMKRFATNKMNNPGLGSKMFKWAVRTWGFTKVVAFVDQRWFTGEFKSISGFEVDGVTPPALHWVKAKQRFHRRAYTKKILLKMPQFTGSNMTKSAMMQKLGYNRIWDCGKIRLLWVNRSS